MYRRSQGDRIGKIDKDGIAEWYPKCKVRKEGDYYIATPHTTNPTLRRKRKEKPISVSVKDGEYMLENYEDGQVIEQAEESSQKGEQEPKNERVNVVVTTHKEIFDELHDKYEDLKPPKRKRAIYDAMLPLFKNADEAKLFVDEHWRRKGRNYYTRKQRFKYKAYNQEYSFFFTITYDDKKHTEESFENSLKLAFSNLHKRHGCLFQGVWERGEENGRLHFHGLIADKNRKILDGLELTRDYNPKTGKVKEYLQSKYFADKFGRNEFSEIIPQLYDSAIKYITKYLSKQGVKPYYSKGLYQFIESDINGEDVICQMSEDTSRDIRLILAKDFNIWQDGELIGKASPETMAQAKKIS